MLTITNAKSYQGLWPSELKYKVIGEVPGAEPKILLLQVGVSPEGEALVAVKRPYSYEITVLELHEFLTVDLNTTKLLPDADQRPWIQFQDRPDTDRIREALQA